VLIPPLFAGAEIFAFAFRCRRPRAIGRRRGGEIIAYYPGGARGGFDEPFLLGRPPAVLRPAAAGRHGCAWAPPSGSSEIGFLVASLITVTTNLAICVATCPLVGGRREPRRSGLRPTGVGSNICWAAGVRPIARRVAMVGDQHRAGRRRPRSEGCPDPGPPWQAAGSRKRSGARPGPPLHPECMASTLFGD